MTDVWLLGNVVIDHILTCPNFRVGRNNTVSQVSCRAGGLANMLPALSGLDVTMTIPVGEDWFEWDLGDWAPDLINVEQRPGPSSISHIAICDGERTSMTHWGAGRRAENLCLGKARCVHVAYLDVLKGLDMKVVRDQAELVTGDMCLNDPTARDVKRTLEYIKDLDVLFLSSEELAGLITVSSTKEGVEELRKKTGVRAIVCHWKNGSIISDQSGTTSTDVPASRPYTGDVTGAGDLFAGAVIKGLLGGKKLRIAVESAHKMTTVLLRRRG